MYSPANRCRCFIGAASHIAFTVRKNQQYPVGLFDLLENNSSTEEPLGGPDK